MTPEPTATMFFRAVPEQTNTYLLVDSAGHIVQLNPDSEEGMLVLRNGNYQSCENDADLPFFEEFADLKASWGAASGVTGNWKTILPEFGTRQVGWYKIGDYRIVVDYSEQTLLEPASVPYYNG